MDFYGNFTHRLDNKGRVSIPSKYRKILEDKYKSGELFVTVLDGALSVYPMKEWEKIMRDRLSAVDTTTPEGRKKVRQFASNADEIEVDAQGRVLLSTELQLKAGLIKGEEVVIAGNLNCFEIWHPQRWKKYWEEQNE